MKQPDLDKFNEAAEKLHKLEVEYATVPNILEHIADALKDLGMDESEYKFLMSDIQLLREKYDRDESQPTQTPREARPDETL